MIIGIIISIILGFPDQFEEYIKYRSWNSLLCSIMYHFFMCTGSEEKLNSK